MTGRRALAGPVRRPPRVRSHTESGRRIPWRLARHFRLPDDDEDDEEREIGEPEVLDPYAGGMYEPPSRRR
jgi:hypothetical protein